MGSSGAGGGGGPQGVWICIGETWGVFTLGDTRK